MIITCEKCSTKFNLDESVLKKEGSKVRCSMCKHIFTAYPPHHDDNPESEPSLMSATKDANDELAVEIPHDRDSKKSIEQNKADKIEIESFDLPVRGEEKENLSSEGHVIQEEILFEEDIDFSITGTDKPPEDNSLTKRDNTGKDFEEISQPLELESDQSSEFSESSEFDLDFSLGSETDQPVERVDSGSGLDNLTIEGDSPSIDGDLELDLDFSLEKEVPIGSSYPQKSQSEKNLTEKNKTGKMDLSSAIPMPDIESGLELDLDFSTDNETFEKSRPQNAITELPSLEPAAPPSSSRGSMDLGIEDPLELDLDFSLDSDEKGANLSSEKSSMPDSSAPENLDDFEFSDTLELDFSLDDSDDFNLDQAIDVSSDMGDGMDLDLDFSLDDDFAIKSPAEKTPSDNAGNLQMQREPDFEEETLELDLDFSLDEEMDLQSTISSPKSSLPKTSLRDQKSFDIEDGMELDFSIDDDTDPPLPAKKTERNTSPSLSSGQTLGQKESFEVEEGLELDLDFSSVDETDSRDKYTPSMESEQTEIDLNDDFDIDFTSSGEENDSSAVAKKTSRTELDIETISPIDLDFEDAADIDDDDLIYNDEPSDQSKPENRISLSKNEPEKTTLGGHPISTSAHEKTLLGNRAAAFEESPLFEKKRSSAGRLILVPLIFILLIAGGYAASVFTGHSIPFISDLKIPFLDNMAKKSSAPVKLSPDQKSVSGKFITNTMSGTLFVITGQVVNQSDVACRDIKVQGTLLAANKVKVKDKTVICGNIISEDQLKKLDMNAINSTLYSSDNSERFTLGPKKSIPFMIVFSNFPDNLENFTVAVTEYRQVSEKN